MRSQRVGRDIKSARSFTLSRRFEEIAHDQSGIIELKIAIGTSRVVRKQVRLLSDKRPTGAHKTRR